MKKAVSLLLAGILSVGLLAGCGGGADDKTITVGATPNPHAEILEQIKPELEAKGYTLVVKEFSDYSTLNPALVSGDMDANFFQHEPYMKDFNEQNNADLVAAFGVHYEPMGIYAGKTKSLEELKDGATISIPSDGTNEARALWLLESQGLIKLKDDAGVNATPVDIVENPKNLQFSELGAEQLPRSLQDVDLAVINGNYALQGGLKISDALAIEDKESVGAKTYQNIVAVRAEDVDSAKTQALKEALQSDAVRQFIEEKYPDGSVVTVF